MTYVTQKKKKKKPIKKWSSCTKKFFFGVPKIFGQGEKPLKNLGVVLRSHPMPN